MNFSSAILDFKKMASFLFSKSPDEKLFYFFTWPSRNKYYFIVFTKPQNGNHCKTEKNFLEDSKSCSPIVNTFR